MPFAYPTVDVGQNTYECYAFTSDPVDDADAYLGASISSAGATWNALSTTLPADQDMKGRAIVSASRWLDSAQWQGVQADLAQHLQWPRSGLTGVDPTLLPTSFVNAVFELAALLVDNPDLRAELQNPTAKSLRAGSVSIDYFRPLGETYGAKDVQTITPFPSNVMSFIQQWLQGAGGTCSVFSSGTDEDGYDVDFGLNRGL